jgi:hypothetical protein
VSNVARAGTGLHSLYQLLVWNERPTGDGPRGTSHLADEVKRIGTPIGIANPAQL